MNYLERKIHKYHHKLLPYWAIRKPVRCISYNTNQDRTWKSRIGPTSFPSAVMLYQTSEGDEKLLSIIQWLYNKYGPDKIVYGTKNKNGTLRWEFYYYPSANFPVSINQIIEDCKQNGLEHQKGERELATSDAFLISFDYQKIDSTTIDFYFMQKQSPTESDEVYQVVVYNYGTGKPNGEYIIDTHQNIKNNLSFYLEKIKINDPDIYLWIQKELDRFDDTENIIILNKSIEIGIGWFGIGYHSFKKFLEENAWPDNLKLFWEENKKSLKHLPNECIIHYDISGKTIRSAFYGII